MELKQQPKPEHGWAIWMPGIGFYTDWQLTRRQAIEAHLEAVGGTWKQRYKYGERAVAITISPRKGTK